MLNNISIFFSKIHASDFNSLTLHFSSLSQLFDLKTGPITGLHFEYFPRTRSNPDDHFLVIATSPFRYYEFIGGPTFERLFDSYHTKNILTYKELPINNKRGGSPNSELHLLKTSRNGPAESFAWLSNAGLFHGNLTYGRKKIGDSAIKDSEIIQFDNKSMVISVAITEFHTVVAFPDKLQVYMQPPGLCGTTNESDPSEISQIPISSLKVVFQESFTRGKLIGLTVDESNGTIYAYTDSSVYKLLIADEERDVWRLYLEQALDPNVSKEEHFDMALRLCKHDAATRDIVLTAKADYYFKLGQYRNAANIYAKTTKSFEEVAISFSNKGQKDALRVFLLNKLKSILSKVTKEHEDATQLSCLCTWLTEMYLDKMNELYDEGDKRKKEYDAVEKEFRKFLEANRKYLNRETTFTLISSHGHVQEVLYYAMLIEDYERVISHCITEGDYAGALNILNKFCKAKQYEEYFYKFAPILMQHMPEEMVDVLTSKQRVFQPGRLIPALIRYVATNKSEDGENHVIRYLEWCIKQNEDPAIHNLLLSLYANLDDDTKLIQFLNTEGDSNYYDPKYALRICTEKGKTEACVRLYSSMGLYEDAVELALSANEIRLARECADKPEDDEFKKKMWLRIAKHVIEKEKDVKKAIEFLNYTDKIKLEDILPFFPDFVLIDDFKDEICKSLEEYKNEIEDLKTDMQDATQNANLIREDIKELKHRYGYITANAKCDGSHCFKSILAKDFYLFPCQHMFHTDCLIEEIQKHVSRSKGEKILELNNKRKRLIESGQLNNLTMATPATPETDQLSNPTSAFTNTSSGNTIKDEMKELDDLISSECPFCGEIMISSIDTPFVDEDDGEYESWSLRSVVMNGLDDDE